MKKKFAIIFVTIVILFGLLNYYIGLRTWQWMNEITSSQLSSWVFWVLFWMVALSFPLARLTGRYLPRFIIKLLTIVGAYWLPVFLYTLPFLIIIDAARRFNRWFEFIPVSVAQNAHLVEIIGGVVAMLVLIILAYGIWRARNPVITRYEVTIPKSGGNHRQLHIVLVSDLHVGAINGKRRLQHMIHMVNELHPDLILLAGDIVDDDFFHTAAQDTLLYLNQFTPKLGTFSVLGNHEYLAGHLDEYRLQIEKAGIQLLEDQWVKIDHSFYVIGRNDISGDFFSGRSRKPLSELLQDVDQECPLFLMDHQPNRLEEAQKAGIDLLVCGHTHRGQVFPFQYITRKIFEVDWGYLYKEAMHVIVSLGFGTWGPPVRIGNRPEVVSIQVRLGE